MYINNYIIKDLKGNQLWDKLQQKYVVVPILCSCWYRNMGMMLVNLLPSKKLSNFLMVKLVMQRMLLGNSQMVFWIKYKEQSIARRYNLIILLKISKKLSIRRYLVVSAQLNNLKEIKFRTSWATINSLSNLTVSKAQWVRNSKKNRKTYSTQSTKPDNNKSNS